MIVVTYFGLNYPMISPFKQLKYYIGQPNRPVGLTNIFLKRAKSMIRSVFQYIKSEFVRWRIYKVYVAPIIEWYLPTIALKPKHDLAKLNVVESFQHQMLCMVSGACTKSSSKRLAEVMAEAPVSFKLTKLCHSLKRRIHRDRNALMGAHESEGSQGVTLRSQKTISRKWTGVDKRDFGDAIFTLGDTFTDNIEGQKKYLRKKGKSVNRYRLEFDVQKVRTWVKINNAEISRKMRERVRNDEG